MPLVASKSKAKKADAILADATDRLLRATKKKMLRENGPIDYEKLTRDGLSAALIDRLKAALTLELSIAAKLHKRFHR